MCRLFYFLVNRIRLVRWSLFRYDFALEIRMIIDSIEIIEYMPTSQLVSKILGNHQCTAALHNYRNGRMWTI